MQCASVEESKDSRRAGCVDWAAGLEEEDNDVSGYVRIEPC